MTVRRGLAFVAFSVLLPLAGPSYASARACDTGGGTVKASSPYAIVWYAEGRTYACLRSQGTARALGDASPDDTFPSIFTVGPQLRLNGRFVAYQRSFVGGGANEYEVTLLDLRTGKRKSLGAESATPDEAAEVSDIVLRATGAVAWIGLLPDGQREVRRYVPGAHARRLAIGTTIAPTSLTTRADALEWTDSGAGIRRARFPRR